MPNVDNPAGRLHDLLVRVQKGANAPMKVAWAAALGTDTDDDAALLVRMGSVLRLPRQVRDEAAKLDNVGTVDDFLRHLPAVELVLGNFFSNDRNWFNKNLPGEATYGLQLLSNVLSANRPQAHLNEGQLTALRSTASDLLNEVDAAGLQFDVAEELESIILDLIEAIDRHGISGADPIRKAAQSGFGRSLMLKVDVQTGRQSGGEAEVSAIHRVGKTMIAVAIALSTLSGLLSLPANVDDFSDWVEERYIEATTRGITRELPALEDGQVHREPSDTPGPHPPE